MNSYFISFLMYIVMTIIGIVVSYFCYDIYKLTKGGSKGWKYLAIGGISIGVYAIWGSIDILFLSLNPFRQIIMFVFHIPFLFFFQFFMPLGTEALVSDLKIKRPKWYTKNNILYSIVFLYSLLITYNLLTPFKNFGDELASIVLFLLPIINIFACYGFYLISKQAKKLFWYILFIGGLIITLGVPGYQFYGICCEGPSIGVDIRTLPEMCWGYEDPYIYAPVIPEICIKFLLPIFKISPIFVILAALMDGVGFILLWKSMKS